MKKLFASSFGWTLSWRTSPAMNSQGLAAPKERGLIKLWLLSMVLLLGAILLGFSAPVLGQAVNATLLGTVTDSSWAAVANVKVSLTQKNTGVSRVSPTKAGCN